jgi:hypothetical protein
MQDGPLTADECDELAEVLRQDASALSDGPKKEGLLALSEGYRDLARTKRMVFRKVN